MKDVYPSGTRGIRRRPSTLSFLVKKLISYQSWCCAGVYWCSHLQRLLYPKNQQYWRVWLTRNSSMALLEMLLFRFPSTHFAIHKFLAPRNCQSQQFFIYLLDSSIMHYWHPCQLSGGYVFRVLKLNLKITTLSVFPLCCGVGVTGTRTMDLIITCQYDQLTRKLSRYSQLTWLSNSTLPSAFKPRWKCWLTTSEKRQVIKADA